MSWSTQHWAIIAYAVGALVTVLKRWNEALAFGYVAFDMLEATLLAVGGAMFAVLDRPQPTVCDDDTSGPSLVLSRGRIGTVTAVLGGSASRARLMNPQTEMKPGTSWDQYNSTHNRRGQQVKGFSMSATSRPPEPAGRADSDAGLDLIHDPRHQPYR